MDNLFLGDSFWFRRLANLDFKRFNSSQVLKKKIVTIAKGIERLSFSSTSNRSRESSITNFDDAWWRNSTSLIIFAMTAISLILITIFCLYFY